MVTPKPMGLRHVLAVLVAAIPGAACAGVLGFDDLSLDPKYLEGGASEGGEAAPPADAGVDAAADVLMCVALPPALDNEVQLCDDLREVLNRCGECEQCHQNNLSNCTALGDGLSDAVKAAFHACKAGLPCGNIVDYGKDPCLLAFLTTATYSAAQLAAKNAYCNACTSNAFECANFFNFGGDAGILDFGDAGGADGAGGVTGIGAYVALGNDTSAAAVASSCSGGFNCNPYVYLACSVGPWCKRVPADACDPTFCNH